MDELTKEQIEAFEKQLLERREEIKELERISRSSQETVKLDQSRVGRLSRMDALQGQAMAAETARRRKVELQRIEAALRRIASDDFGYCVRCDEEIPLNRLRTDPSTPTCLRCAQIG